MSILRAVLALSVLGLKVLAQNTTADNSSLPLFLTNNPLPQGFPWGTKTANNTNMFDPPVTGVIRSYDFTITRETRAPDGYQKEMILINGDFPGPLIEANWGDTIQVTVHNELEDLEEGVSLHWHGILQKTSQWMDGVPGITQCPIRPGSSFTYTFLADLYGTSWYHSHYTAQYADGLFGPMIIHGPQTLPYDIDKGAILLTDYYHQSYLDILPGVVGTNRSNVVPQSDNNLINGRNNFNCSKVAPGDKTPCKSNAGITNFRFTPGKVHRLRLINAGAEGTQEFSIDGHSMTVIANDFVDIEPYETKVVTLGIGQRTDVLVTGLPHGTGAYFMRSSLAGCSSTQNPDATAIVYYQHEAISQPVTSTPWPEWVSAVASTNCQNDDLEKTVPWYPLAPEEPTVTETINITFGQNKTGNWVWEMNGSSFRVDYNAPVLFLSNLGNNSYPDDPQWNVLDFQSNSSIRIVLENSVGVAHPMHLHGHNFFVLAVGNDTETWDGHITRPSNPQRRDVQILPANGYMVLQITADNPGVWPLHCHIAWHVSGGLYVSVLERPDDIAKLQIPSIMAQTCRDWADFTNRTVIDQIDSGL